MSRMELVPLPIDWSAAQIAVRDLSDEELDLQIARVVVVEALGRLLRVERGRRTELRSGRELLPGSSSSQTDLNRRSEETLVARWADNDTTADAFIQSNGWKKCVREARNRGFGTPTTKLTPPKGTYDLIYVDPPWRYDFAQSASRQIENHYGTENVEDLIPHKPNAAPNAACYMWATSPKLVDCLHLLDKWGFTYKTNMVWVKDRIGMGYWARSRHELLVIGTKGQFSPPPEPLRPDSVIESPRGRHSTKPLEVIRMLDQFFPDARKLEMYSRNAQPGWEAWGNEA